MWQAGETLPGGEHLADRGVDGDGRGHARFRRRSLSVFAERGALILADLPRGVRIHGRDADHRGRRGRDPAAVRILAAHRPGQEGEIEGIAANARPEPAGWVGLIEDADAARQLARANGAQKRMVAAVPAQADQLRDPLWGDQRNQTEPHAEPAQRAGQAVRGLVGRSACFTVAVAVHGASRRVPGYLAVWTFRWH
ncbi:MAG: hypothetical protein K0S78_2777 [Thermomicrobiales bacterium]|nr:hypothetical protein [Thermomicrobiales bacterium]